MIEQRPFPTQTNSRYKKILANGFLLLLPIFVWNLLFWAKLPPAYSNDQNVPDWLLFVENVLRIGVFGFPLFLTMRLKNRKHKVGLVLYAIGSVLYYGAWLLVIFWPETAVATHPFVSLAPYYTPLLFFAGLGMMGNSPPYILAAILFTLIHTYHGLLNFGYI